MRWFPAEDFTDSVRYRDQLWRIAGSPWLVDNIQGFLVCLFNGVKYLPDTIAVSVAAV